MLHWWRLCSLCLVVVLWWSCQSTVWTPQRTEDCDPFQSDALKAHSLWQETFGLGKRMRGCLRVGWDGNEGKGVGLLVEIAPDGKTFAENPQVPGVFDAATQWQAPASSGAAVRRFSLFVFGVKRRLDGIALQRQYCSDTMAANGYSCAGASADDCWFSWSFRPLSDRPDLKKAQAPGTGNSCQLSIPKRGKERSLEPAPEPRLEPVLEPVLEGSDGVADVSLEPPGESQPSEDAGVVEGPPEPSEAIVPDVPKEAPADKPVPLRLACRVGQRPCITTLAGIFPSGAKGPLDRAWLRHPYGMAFDRQGNLYISDHIQHKLFRVNAAKTEVELVAGGASAGFVDGPGLSAAFRNPAGLMVLANGDVLIADRGNHCIRRYVPSTGLVDTYLGTCQSPGKTNGQPLSSKFWLPEFLHLASGQGVVLITDFGNNCVRSYSLALKMVVNGVGKCGTAGYMDSFSPQSALFDGPAGIADTTGGTLFVDRDNHCIRNVVRNTGEVQTFIGACQTSGNVSASRTATRLKLPNDIVVTANEDAYISDMGNHCIRKYTKSSSMVTTLAGQCGRSGFKDGQGTNTSLDTPRSLVLSGTTTLLVADAINRSIRQINTQTQQVSTLIGGAYAGTRDGIGPTARFRQPRQFAWNGGELLFVADTFNHCIRTLDLKTGVVSTIAGTCGTGSSGWRNGAANTAKFRSPWGVVWDGVRKALYVSESGGHCIRQIDFSGGVPGEVANLAGGATCAPGDAGVANGNAAQARFFQPSFLSFDGKDTLWITDRGNHCIRKLDLKTKMVSTVIGLCNPTRVMAAIDGNKTKATFLVPEQSAWDGANALYIADSFAGCIRKLDLQSSILSTVAGKCLGGSQTPLGIGKQPVGLAYSRNGNVLFIGYALERCITSVLFQPGPRLGGAYGRCGDATRAYADAGIKQSALGYTSGLLWIDRPLGGVFFIDLSFESIRAMLFP